MEISELQSEWLWRARLAWESLKRIAVGVCLLVALRRFVCLYCFVD